MNTDDPMNSDNKQGDCGCGGMSAAETTELPGPDELEAALTAVDDEGVEAGADAAPEDLDGDCDESALDLDDGLPMAAEEVDLAALIHLAENNPGLKITLSF